MIIRIITHNKMLGIWLVLIKKNQCWRGHFIRLALIPWSVFLHFIFHYIYLFAYISNKISGWCVERAWKFNGWWSIFISFCQIKVDHNKWWFQRHKKSFDTHYYSIWNGFNNKRMKVEKNKTNQIKDIRKGWTLTIIQSWNGF